jgi:hypothetical protein
MEILFFSAIAVNKKVGYFPEDHQEGLGNGADDFMVFFPTPQLVRKNTSPFSFFALFLLIRVQSFS